MADELTEAWELSRLAVSPEFQGTGLGQAIFGAAVALCREQGAPDCGCWSALTLNGGHIYEKYASAGEGDPQWG